MKNYISIGFIKNLLIAIAIFLSLLSIYTPIYETNDDVGMSMIVHGYGISMHPSPYMMFSNILYGYILNLLPKISGIYPYSYMTFFALFIFTISLLTCFEKLNINRFYSIILIIIVLIRPISMPQFTVNSGLLAVSSLIAIITYTKTLSYRYAVIGLFLALYSFLIRYQELCFVFLVGSPFLFNKNLLNKKIILLEIFFILICLYLIYLNNNAYSGIAFNHYNSLNDVRVPFNDYQVADYFINHKDILIKYNYSTNDMKLLENFIFADDKLTNPLRMSQLISIYFTHYQFIDNEKMMYRAFKTIGDHNISLFILISFIGLIYSKSKLQTLFAWIIFILIISLFGLLGRPSILRIYYPVMALLSVIPFTSFVFFKTPLYITEKKFHVLNIVTFLIVFCIVSGNNYKYNQLRTKKAKLAYNDFQKLDNKIFYVLGALLPFEYIYLPLHKIDKNPKLYWFSSSYYLPNTYSDIYAFSNNGFSHAIEFSIPINIIAGKWQMEIIEKYTKEHYNKRINYLALQKLNTFSIYKIATSNNLNKN